MAEPLGTVVLFARAPRLGQGKRRLAREIGDLAALRFSRRMLDRAARLVASEQGWRASIVLDPPNAVVRPGAPFAHRPAARAPRSAQEGRDLGRRMLQALNATPPGPRVLIGADIPGITPGMLRRALLACRASDFVFGPAADGGFWLIGTRRRAPLPLFDGVAWSQPTTLTSAAARLPIPARVAYVDRLQDVDIAADLSLFA